MRLSRFRANIFCNAERRQPVFSFPNIDAEQPPQLWMNWLENPGALFWLPDQPEAESRLPWPQ
jgi:hypothetical protein